MLLLIILFQSTFATVPPGSYISVRRWKATVNGQDGKYKGLLYAVTDSSITLLQSGARYTEILFSKINNIKLVKRNGKENTALFGMVAGSLVGTAIGIATIPKRQDDDFEYPSRTVNAFWRVFLGGIIGTAVGAGIGWLIPALFGGKKFAVQHDPKSYIVLRSKLERYSMK